MTIDSTPRPSAVVRTLPVELYVDPERFRRERTGVLTRGWRYVGDAGRVAEPGSYTTGRLDETPLVVTRDGDGVLHGLVNTCRHRGAEVAAGGGRATSLTCPYHGWNYGLDGRLRVTPGMSALDEGLRLPPVRVATLGSLLFATTDPDVPELSVQLADWLDQSRTLSGVDFDGLSLRQSVGHELSANWKAVCENFVECYHCSLVHKTSLPQYGGDDYTVEPSGGYVAEYLAADRFSFCFLMPTSMLSVYGRSGAVVARRVEPIAVDRTFVRHDYWFDARLDEAERQEWVAWFETVIGEDHGIIESVQRGMAGGHLERGYLDPVREAALVHFHDMIRSQPD